MPKNKHKSRVDLSRVTSDTPPRSASTSSEVSNQEPCNPNLPLPKLISKVTDKEVVEHLTKNIPEFKDEALYLFNCPEKIGMEPLRDIIINQAKDLKQAPPLVKALVVGLKAGLSYSLREQHQNYIDMFKDMKNIMQESGKLMT